MCENLVLFCLSCKKSPQVEWAKKKGTMDINVMSVVVVTSLGEGLASLRTICMHFDISQPLS